MMSSMVIERGGEGEVEETRDVTSTSIYFIVKPEKAGFVNLSKFLVGNAKAADIDFLESSVDHIDSGGGGGGWAGRAVGGDHRWVIVVSVLVRKIIAILGKPMQWNGFLVEFFLNLLSQNGGVLGLLSNLLGGTVVVPKRGSDTFISAIGHLDSRLDLHKDGSSLNLADLNNELGDVSKVGSRVLMDLCMMASKLAYENANVVKNIVVDRWKMHFVEFCNCWNDYQKEWSTQAFILCDKPKDANLILISFRGTEPFDADDWSTDFDYSWYEIPNLGKVHMGFLEALGLGSRARVSTFQANLQPTGRVLKTNSSNGTGHPSGTSSSTSEDKTTAYYAVQTRLKSLLEEHKNAKFIVTGHSLGGALAILFPMVLLLHEEEKLMERLLGVYTFGQPRVGDRQLGRFMEARLGHPVSKYSRVVYCNDLVPRLPYDNKTFLFKHFGLCHYYNSCYTEQTVEEEPNRNYFGLAYILPEYLNAVWELVRSFTIGHWYGPEYKEGWFSIFLRVWGLAMPGLSAHSPRDYVNSIRLGRETPTI